MSGPSRSNHQHTTTCTTFGQICTHWTNFAEANAASLRLPFVLPVPHTSTRSRSSLPLSCYPMESMMGCSWVNMWYCNICTIWRKYRLLWTHSSTTTRLVMVMVVVMEAMWQVASSGLGITMRITLVIVLVVSAVVHNPVITFATHSRPCFAKDWMWH